MTSGTLLGTITRTGDTAEASFDRVYDTDPADLWRAVTEPDRLARWFAPVDGDLEPGGTFTVRFDDNAVRGCRLTACDAPRGFAWEWPHATHTSLVTVAVEPAGDQARLRVTHARLSASSVAGYTAGWDVYVRRLDDEVAGRAVADTWDSDWGRAYEGYAGQLD
ncbi:MAG TPA: SRPBCC family protein [Lapillicoccus sp.]|nr:SRPBCC family protein [Lapillicoccus sp.]